MRGHKDLRKTAFNHWNGGFENIIKRSESDVTGAERWRFDPKPETSSNAYLACRGVAYYQAKNPNGECAQRIIAPVAEARLVALDDNTGKLCPGFGVQGFVSLRQYLGDVPKGFHFVNSPPFVAQTFTRRDAEAKGLVQPWDGKGQPPRPKEFAINPQYGTPYVVKVDPWLGIYGQERETICGDRCGRTWWFADHIRRLRGSLCVAVHSVKVHIHS